MYTMYRSRGSITVNRAVAFLRVDDQGLVEIHQSPQQITAEQSLKIKNNNNYTL